MALSTTPDNAPDGSAVKLSALARSAGWTTSFLPATEKVIGAETAGLAMVSSALFTPSSVVFAAVSRAGTSTRSDRGNAARTAFTALSTSRARPACGRTATGVTPSKCTVPSRTGRSYRLATSASRPLSRVSSTDSTGVSTRVAPNRLRSRSSGPAESAWSTVLSASTASPEPATGSVSTSGPATRASDEEAGPEKDCATRAVACARVSPDRSTAPTFTPRGMRSPDRAYDAP